MAINFISGLNITSQEPVDSRLVMTKAQMLAAKPARMPSVYFAVCSDDGQMYVYNANNEKDDETGKFRVLSSSNTVNQLISSDTNNVLQVSEDGGLTVAISQDSDNMIQQAADGLKVAQSESIDDDTINNLFNEEEENV